MTIVVFGSINMDLVARTPRLPVPGETLTGYSFVTVPGGKGANQAVACARLGAPTRMVGCVGNDLFGVELRNHLMAEGVDVAHVRVAESSSGVALIAVDDVAQNNIIVIPGANGAVGEVDLVALGQALAGADLLLLQLEVPLTAVAAAARLAHQQGIPVILDPAPVQPLLDDLYQLVDILTPNETEAAALVGFAIQDSADAARAARRLQERGVAQIIIKMGHKGAYVADGGQGHFYPAIPVIAVDTVAAGDAFNGALGVALSEQHLPLSKAIHWGLAGGALAVTKVGAQQAMPTRSALLSLISHPF